MVPRLSVGAAADTAWGASAERRRRPLSPRASAAPGLRLCMGRGALQFTRCFVLCVRIGRRLSNLRLNKCVHCGDLFYCDGVINTTQWIAGGLIGTLVEFLVTYVPSLW